MNQPLLNPQVTLPAEEIKSFCSKWKIAEFSLFGSVLRDDFGPESDIDVLVAFERDHGWGLYEVIDMEDELQSIFGRRVHLVMKAGLRNPFRRREILDTRQVIYAA